MIDLTPDLMRKLSSIAQKNNVRASERKLPQRIHKNLLLRKFIEQQGYCYYCETPLFVHNITVEHIIPMSSGGTNGEQNVSLCCKSCNDKQNVLHQQGKKVERMSQSILDRAMRLSVHLVPQVSGMLPYYGSRKILKLERQIAAHQWIADQATQKVHELGKELQALKAHNERVESSLSLIESL